jgi:hypothetical protein
MTIFQPLESSEMGLKMKPYKLLFVLKTLSIIGILLGTVSTELILTNGDILKREKDSSQQWFDKPLRTMNSLGRQRCEESGYLAGDGNDTEAIAFSNIEEMLAQWGQPTGESYRTFLHSDSIFLDEVVIAIIDDGITKDM